jgi:hypothetical protein
MLYSATAIKRSRDTHIGVRLWEAPDGKSVLIIGFDDHGLFSAKRCIRVGMKLRAINGMECTGMSLKQIYRTLNRVQGELTLTAEALDLSRLAASWSEEQEQKRGREEALEQPRTENATETPAGPQESAHPSEEGFFGALTEDIGLGIIYRNTAGGSRKNLVAREKSSHRQENDWMMTAIHRSIAVGPLLGLATMV